MQTDRNWSLLTWFLLFCLAMIFGGGGANYGFLNLVVQLAAMVIIGFRLDDIRGFWGVLPSGARWLIGATILLPLLQTVPLPPALWQALPGRELVRESLDLIGSGDDWFSISIDPRRTLLAATALVAPFAAAALTGVRPKSEVVWIPAAIVAVGIFSLLVGMVQIASGNEALSFYARKSSDQLYGLFANRNSAGLFFVIALVSLISLPEKLGQRRISPIAFYAIALVLVLGTLLTQSRSATLLLVIPLAFLGVRKLPLLSGISRRKLVFGLGGLVVGGLGALALALQSDRLGQTWQRFSSFDDMRWDFWKDTVPAIEHYWAVGSGMGTYRDTIEVFESLESISPLNSGRAHNEYLELSLEAGLLGPALIVAWFFLSGLLLRRAFAQGSHSERNLAIGAILAFAAIAMQSAVDYPLRSQALLCVAASLFGMLVSIAARSRKPAGGTERVE